MPNIRSAKKRVRSNFSKEIRNKRIKSSLKTALKKAMCDDSSNELRLKAISMLDRAVSKGIIHKNNAARRKSKLAKRISA